MKFISLPVNFNNEQYLVSEFSGNLLIQQRGKKHRADKLPEKLSRALVECNQPYNLKSNQYIKKNLNNFPDYSRKANLMILFCRISLFAAKQYACFQAGIFCNSAQSINYFYSVTSKEEANSLCLPRALFAAKTSEIFNEEGVVFIGAFLPSRAMHAWVIEKGIQPDQRDNIWHQYRPIAAIC